MRIALLPSAYAPAVGGVEVLTARLAHHLAARGHAVEVWTGRSKGDSLPHHEIIEDTRVRRFVFTLPRAAPRSVLEFPVAAVATLRQLRAAVREFKPEVLHVQCFSGNGAYATVLSRQTGIPLVVSLQGETVMDDHDIYDHSVVLRICLRAGLRQAEAVTGCSAFTLKDAQNRFRLNMRKAQVVFNGVDLAGSQPVPVALPFDRYVLGLGRLVRKKGFDLLLDGFAHVADTHPDVGLVIAGEGAEHERLRRHAANLGLSERVHMSGRMSRNDVAAVMQGATVFVMPSRVEPFGMVVLEAWHAGVPVVVTSRGGPPEFVEHGTTGLVVDPFDARALASSLSSLLTSPALRTQLARAASTKLVGFSWPQLVQSYETIYSRFAGTHHVNAP